MNIPRLALRLLLGRRLPITAGDLVVAGISRPVAIGRDSFGIPYIEAETDEDAWFGLGFCQGQDRAFQLEVILRVVRGTLAELVGEKGLALDRLSRRIGFAHSAERQLEVLDDDIRRITEVFAGGVNQGATVGSTQVAHEFRLVRGKPNVLTAVDVLGFAKLQSFLLGSNWATELARMKILEGDGPEAMAALDPAYPRWLPVTSPPGALAGPAADRLSEDVAALTAVAGPGGGSNNWVVSASRTAAGRPLLACDPHLSPSTPPHWYLAHIRTPQWTAAGATLVGAPGFPAGHNDVAAWGITAGLLDDTDLFVEEVDPGGRRVREGDEMVPCDVRTELIRVKGGRTVDEEVLVTPRGPIIGPALDGELGAISIRATWLDPRPVRGALVIHRARDFQEFRSAWEHWPVASLNVLYADVSGTIGWQLAGDAPVRRKGWGTLPLPGWDLEAGWEEDTVPFEEMPTDENPEAGYIATANNRPLAEGDGPFLGVDWLDGYRVARIGEVLEARRDWDLAGLQRLQMDLRSVPWREIRDTVLAVPVEDEAACQAIALLEDWDGVVTADSPAASVFELFVDGMSHRVAGFKAPRSASWVVGCGSGDLMTHTSFALRRVGTVVRLLKESPPDWFHRGWQQEVADALAGVVRELRRRLGPDPRKWAWGRLRPLTFVHPVGRSRLLGNIFNLGPFPWGGDANTIGQAAPPPQDTARNPVFVASMRMVVDVGDWESCRFSLPGGQSGNPVSPHYQDLLPHWLRGDGVPIAWSKRNVDAAAVSTLRLTPSP